MDQTAKDAEKITISSKIVIVFLVIAILQVKHTHHTNILRFNSILYKISLFFLKGSRSLQCDASGRCQCKPGVAGDKCDRCDVDHYDFGPRGCRPCECSVAGSLNNQPSCDPHTGVCACKEHVEGQKCRE